MKILIVTSEGFPVPAVRGGAIETRIENLIEVNEKEQKLDITVVSSFDQEAEKLSQKYNFTKFIFIHKTIGKKLNFIKLILNKVGIKVFNKQFFYSNYSESAYKKVKGNAYDYIFIAGGSAEDYGNFLGHFKRKKMIFNVAFPMEGYKVLEKGYEYFYCCSEFTQKLLGQNKVISTDRIKKFSNYIDVEKFNVEVSEEEKNEIMTQYGISKDDFVICFWGRISKEKGISQLIQALKIMKNRANCKLLIIGNAGFGNKISTPYDAELKELIEDIQEQVIFTGFIHHMKLPRVLKVGDVAVLPSIWEEAAGCVVPEAMAAGLPLIITNSGGMVEYVTKENAIIVERNEDLVHNLAESMDYLYENNNIKKNMAISSRNKALEFSKEKYYERFIKLLLGDN